MATTTTVDPIQLDYDEVNNALSEIIAEAGDTKITGGACVYFKYDDSQHSFQITAEPSCVIGQVFHKLGIDFARLSEASHAYGETGSWSSDSEINEKKIRYFVAERVIECDVRTRVLVTVAQEQQDDGVSWQWSVERAREAVDRLPSFDGRSLNWLRGMIEQRDMTDHYGLALLEAYERAVRADERGESS